LESLTTQVASLIVIISLNFLASLLIWLEYSDHKLRFLKFTALAQTFVLLWHLVSIVLVYDFGGALMQSMSALFFFLFVYFYLAIAVEKFLNTSKAIYRFGIASAAVILPATYFFTAFLEVFWIFNGLLLLITPIVTMVFFRQLSYKLVILFQVLIVASFLLSVTYFRVDFQAAGGLFYVLMAIFQSILTVTFIITSTRVSRKEFAEKERDYRVFFETVYEVFFKLDEKGVIKEISAPILQFGLTSEDLVGKKLADYLTEPQLFISKLDLAKYEEGSFEYVGSINSKFGQINCEIISSVLKHEDEESVHFAGSIRNTQERSLLEKQFIEAQRMESLGLLAGGVAHDFNNLLQGIVGYTELLLRDESKDDKFRKRSLNIILDAGSTAANLCKQLLQFAGRGITQKESVDLVEAVQEVVSIISPSCPVNSEIKVNLPNNPVFIDGDKSQVKQVFLNLIKNAVEAVDENGLITVSLEQCELDGKAISKYKLNQKIVTGNYHVFKVEDNGAGIKAGVGAKIFEPFYTTKERGQGLGLSAVSGILRIHNAGIAFESKSDTGSGTQTGTAFRVFFPVIEELN
jgi:PAS domain S-box-containing protein